MPSDASGEGKKQNKYLRALIASAKDKLAQEGYIVGRHSGSTMDEVLLPGAAVGAPVPTELLFTKGQPETVAREFLRDTRLAMLIGRGPDDEGTILALANQLNEFMKGFPADELANTKTEEVVEYRAAITVMDSSIAKLLLYAETQEEGITEAFYRTRLGRKINADIDAVTDKLHQELLRRASPQEMLEATLRLTTGEVPEAAILKVRTARGSGEPTVLGVFPQPRTGDIRVVTGTVDDNGNKSISLSSEGRLLCTCGAHQYSSRGQCYHLKALSTALGGDDRLRAYVRQAGNYTVVRSPGGQQHFIPPIAPIAGAKLGERDQFIPQLRKGAKLELVREAGNTADPNAIGIWTTNSSALKRAKRVYERLTPQEQAKFRKTNGYIPNNPTRIRVGYIPKHIARGLAVAMEAGDTYTATYSGEIIPNRIERGPSQMLPTGASWGIYINQQPAATAAGDQTSQQTPAQSSRGSGGRRSSSSATGTRQRRQST